MDKNSVIGFGLLMVLLIGYIFYNQRAEAGYLEQKRSDSLAQARLKPRHWPPQRLLQARPIQAILPLPLFPKASSPSKTTMLLLN